MLRCQLFQQSIDQTGGAQRRCIFRQAWVEDRHGRQLLAGLMVVDNPHFKPRLDGFVHCCVVRRPAVEGQQRTVAL